MSLAHAQWILEARALGGADAAASLERRHTTRPQKVAFCVRRQDPARRRQGHGLRPLLVCKISNTKNRKGAGDTRGARVVGGPQHTHFTWLWREPSRHSVSPVPQRQETTPAPWPWRWSPRSECPFHLFNNKFSVRV